MLKHFTKYQSLGNDFILFDWYKKPGIYVQNALKDPEWQKFVKESCDRHFGVGADGVLILKSTSESSFPEVLIFNADGSQAENCLNGIRCVAHYLFTHHAQLPQFKIKIGMRVVDCSVISSKKKELIEISTTVGSADYNGPLTVKVEDQTFNGHVVNIGNPHFIIFQGCDITWLQENGQKLEQHQAFPHKTNVEFVWESKAGLPGVAGKVYNVLIYERGCGVTLACGTGAASIIQAMFSLGMVKKDEPVVLQMPGGVLIGSIDGAHDIILKAEAKLVFNGIFENRE